MFKNLDLRNVLFLDIETVPKYADYQLVPEEMRSLWDKKARFIKDAPDDLPEATYRKAGIYAEFGKIICISAGLFTGQKFRLTSFAGDDEQKLLSEFSILLSKFSKPGKLLCAHNGKEFDFPYIARRILINGLPLPDQLNLAGKKPWEVNHLDTMELWKFGDYKHYTSLQLLALLFDIPNPKDDIDGSEVGKIYWETHDIQRIRRYCQKDVITIARLMNRYLGQPMISDEEIEIVNT